MLLMDRNFNPLAVMNKQAPIIAHYQSQWEYTSCVTVRYVSEPRRTISAFVKVLIVTLIQFFSHTKEPLII